MPGEIVKITPSLHEQGESTDENVKYAYILDSVKKGAKTVSYVFLPVVAIPKDKEMHQLELELLRTHRGRISDKLVTTNASPNSFRVIFEPGEIPATGELKLTPINSVQNIAEQKKIEQALAKSFVNQHFSIVNGSPMFVGSIAASRALPKTNDAPYFLDIDVHDAAAAGYIPLEVADILKKFGKISRLGTASNIATDQNPDKLLQIYDKARPRQSMPFDVFSNYITAGYSFFNTEILNNAQVAQAKIPAGAILQFPKKEKVTFKFVERQPDLSIDDAYHTHSFIMNEETYKVLKAAKIRTLREAFDMVQEHGVSPLREAFNKVKDKDFTLREIAKDIREAQELFDHTIENPDEYVPFDWSTQLHYPIREVKVC
jgi:hypothetical protein